MMQERKIPSNYCVIPSVLMENKGVTPRAKVLYLALSGMVDRAGLMWYGSTEKKVLADILKCSVPLATRALKELIEIGYVITKDDKLFLSRGL